MTPCLNYILSLSILLITLSLAGMSCQQEVNSTFSYRGSFTEEQLKKIEYHLQKEWLTEQIDKLTLESNQMKEVLKTINIQH